MDPTANLEEQVRISKRIQDCTHADELRAGQACTRCEADAERLAELVLALDEWIVRGGFLPDAWRR
jgi:hypothetical protein